MKNKLLLCLVLFLYQGAIRAQIAPRNAAVAPDSAYVPVNLNAFANHRAAASLSTQAQVAVNDVPFEMAQSGENNNFFLHKAGWPDWKADPLDFYAAYDNAPAQPTEELPVVKIPTDDYSALWVLASCENDAQFDDVLALRIGIKKSAAQTTYRDFQFRIPRAAQGGGENVVRVLSGENGNVFLMRLPLQGAFSQDFSNHRTLDVEVTKRIRLAVSKPDAARFQYRPLGLPSGVHLYGLTFERSPVRLHLESDEIGHVFNEPQTPRFTVRLQGVTGGVSGALRVLPRATHYDGSVTEFPALEMQSGPLSPFWTFCRALSLPVKKRGYYVFDVRVEQNGNTLLQKRTTFALLPRDTRRYRASSPFGTWDFGGTHHTPDDAAIVGPLYVKAGLRYGMFAFTPEERRRYGIIRGNDPVTSSLEDVAKLDERIAEMKKSGEIPQRWMFFHEHVLSGDHVTRTPATFSGKRYNLNPDEKKRLDEWMRVVVQAAPKLRRAFPGIKLYLGNGTPHLMEEFLRHKLPAESFDVLGNEAASFQRLPESQPTDFVANNPSMWMERHLLDTYGYRNKGVEQSYEVMYPASSPGNLTLREQANYMVRNAMHSLAWKVPVIRFGIIAEPGSSYYFSNWGGTGLMFSRPQLSPKPFFVATATMTQQLDGATFSRQIPTGSTTAYAFEFRKPRGGFVTCVWTPNASQLVELRSSQSQLAITDLMANRKTVSARMPLLIGPDPQFIESSRPLKISAGATTPSRVPAEYSALSAMDDASQWELVNDKDAELEAYNFMQPRLHAPFAMQKAASFEGETNALQIAPVQRDESFWWLPRYTQLRPRTPLEMKGRPTHIGLMVNGNGGWGRIIFEFQDAAGQRWISLGTEQEGKANPWLADWMSAEDLAKMQRSGVSDWNSNDVWGRSAINFTGWRFLRFPMPGNYAGEGYHWPYTSQWRCMKADGTPGDYTVHYPLRLTKLAMTARPRVLYGTQTLAVTRPAIYLKNLATFEGDPDTAFWQPDAGQN